MSKALWLHSKRAYLPLPQLRLLEHKYEDCLQATWLALVLRP